MKFAKALKTRWTAIALLLLISALPAAENNLTFEEQALLSYTRNLENDNAGIVASSIFYLLKLQTAYPNLDVTGTYLPLAELAVDGETPEIRYMAFLARNYQQNPEWLAWLHQLCLEQDAMAYLKFVRVVEHQIAEMGMQDAAMEETAE